MDVVQEIANQLGVASEYVLNEYVPYYMGKTIFGACATTLVFLVVLIFGIIILKKMNKNETVDEFEFAVMLAIFIAVLIVIGIFMIFAVTDLIGGICSPTGAAIHDIVVAAVGD